MVRTTIDFGVDLGTTNSSIALLRGTEVDVIKNNDGHEYTPSAVWLHKNDRLYVGQRAKDRVEDDPKNAFCEFKLQMGKLTEYVFARNGRRMKPEDLSAEVLKILKADVMQRTGEAIRGAVITVPAAFDLPQCNATRKAAELAGFAFSPLLQEPVAAALAYGFQSESDNVFWLVYDLGGGTFDAAIIQVRDGVIQVVNHDGDNQLGGKLIDWEIVGQLLIPSLTANYRLSDFRRGNTKWIAAIAKLKQHAEKAKIQLSRDETAEIIIDYLCEDDLGKPVRFDYELKKKDLERLMEPLILRSINICKKVLQEKRLGVGNIERLLLVGGPTMAPCVRDLIADRNKGLGIPLEFGMDPLTVVAKGAAIFAGTQRIEGISPHPVMSGQFAVELEYKPVGADTEPLVGGRVTGVTGESLAGFTIEFVNAEVRPQWRSGRLGLAPDGTFMTNLWAEKGRQNIFQIELHDAIGTKRVLVPDRLHYTIGMTITDPPLIHSVGVALANNEMEWFIEKGAPLPTRRRVDLKTATNLQHGQAGQILRIPLMEGKNSRADRNQLIGSISIQSDVVKRDMPVGSDIEVTIEMDESRMVRAKAYVPILDDEFEEVINYNSYRSQAKDRTELQKDFDQQKKRLDEARGKAEKVNELKAKAVLHRIDTERMLHDVEVALSASDADGDAADKCEKRLLDLKSAIDEIEDALEWPALAADAENEIEIERKIINNPDFRPTTEEKTAFATLEREMRNTLAMRDVDLLRRKVQEMDRIGLIIMLRQPGWWVGQLENLIKKKAVMRDEGQADIAIAQGQRAINNNDVESLKTAVRQLWSLLPANDADRAKFSDVTR
jgi:molecular chaperone DnaK